jgi:carbamoyl-phosphate synthase small subunit
VAAAVKTPQTIPGSGHRVVLIDLGAKNNIVRCLQKRDCHMVIVPPNCSAADILSQHPAGVVLSDGPGDPADLPHTVETLKELIGKTPLWGISLGHLVLGLALGATTSKLKTGHRGNSHPVQDLATGRVYVTTQNHGFTIDEASLAGLDVLVSHRNINDGTVEGLKHKTLPVFSVQYHPEATPGPLDSEYIFDQFIHTLSKEAR